MAFKKGDKFILELGEERRMFGEFEIAGTDLYVKKDLLEKLTPYKEPEIIHCHECKYNTDSHKCLNPDSFFLVPNDNDFCSYGKRREDG